MDTRLPDSMIRDIQKLSVALDSRGTKLVYVPVASKGLALPRYLGHDADRFGYDVRLARALYADSIAQLRSVGVTTVDTVQALSSPDQHDPTFFKADPRLSDTGLRRIAQATADELGQSFHGETDYRTTPQEEVTLDSIDRFLLQLSLSLIHI